MLAAGSANTDPGPTDLIALARQDQSQNLINGMTEEQWSRYRKYQAVTNFYHSDYDALRSFLLKEAPIGEDIVWAQIATNAAHGPWGDPKALRLILLAGLSPNTRVPDEHIGDFPIFLTDPRKKYLELFALAGADFSLMSGDGSVSIVHGIASAGNATMGGGFPTMKEVDESLEFLLKMGVKLNRKNGKGQTVREYLTRFEPGVGGGLGIRDELKALLDKYGID